MFQVLRIHGESMAPEYKDGDFVLLMKPFRGKLNRGDIVVFDNELYGTLVKSIQKITDGGIYVLGTGKKSLDSRRLGPIKPASIRGKVIWHIHRH